MNEEQIRNAAYAIVKRLKKHYLVEGCEMQIVIEETLKIVFSVVACKDGAKQTA